MSDTFGATDLNQDMPGLGPQPGNVRGPPVQLPSALQGLVKHFIGQGGQGKPNPKFLPPAPGPGGGQKKPPTLGSTDPPDRGARAFAPLPANAPQPPSNFTPYMPPVPRDSAQWGKPEPYPRLPQSFELHGMFQQLGSYFAQHGGYASGPMAAGLAGQSKEYLDGYMKGQDFKMKMAQEQMKLHAAQLEELEQARSIEYADVFARHSAMGDNETALHDDLWKVAVEHGDKDVMAMLEDGASAEKVRQFLAKHEANIRALGAANKKSDEQEAVDALYGLKPREGGGVYDRYAPGATAGTGAAGVGEGTGRGAIPDKDTRAPGVGDPLAPDKDKPADSEADADDIKDPNEKRMHDASVEVLKGFEPKDITSDVLPYAGIAARNMNDKLGQIANDAAAGKIAPDQIASAVRKQVSGKVANDLQDLADYVRPGVGGGGQGGGQGGKEQDYLSLLGHLATLMKPGDPARGVGGWKAANYQAQERFRTDVNTQTVILRSNSLAADGGAVLGDLKELERQGVNTQGLNMDGLLGLATRQPIYAKLYGDWKAYNDAFNTVVTGGRHVESGAQSQESVAPVSYASPAAFRAAIKGHMTDALGYLEGEHRRWETAGGDPRYMPSQNLETEKQLRDMRDMDYLTGTMPGQKFTNKKGITKTWKGGNINPYDPSNWE